jgi:hypothetical protein
MTSRAKAEARKARAIERNKDRSFKKAAQMFDNFTPEQCDAFHAKYCGNDDIPPHEISKRIAREMLASEVREKIKADLPDKVLEVTPGMEDIIPPGATLYGFTDSINDDHVITLLEAMVEGDVVIDDAATHQWFRNKLSEYRDLEIKMDAEAFEMEALATTIGLAQATNGGSFDVLVDTVNDEPDAVGILANEAAQAIFPTSPDDWRDLFPEKVDGFGEGWKQTRVTFNGEGPSPKKLLRHVAEAIANGSSLRVGIIKRFGIVDPVVPS